MRYYKRYYNSWCSTTVTGNVTEIVTGKHVHWIANSDLVIWGNGIKEEVFPAARGGASGVCGSQFGSKHEMVRNKHSLMAADRSPPLHGSMVAFR